MGEIAENIEPKMEKCECDLDSLFALSCLYHGYIKAISS